MSSITASPTSPHNISTTSNRMQSPFADITKSPSTTHPQNAAAASSNSFAASRILPFHRHSSAGGTYSNIAVPLHPFVSPKSPVNASGVSTKKRKFTTRRHNNATRSKKNANLDPKYLHDRLYHTYYRGYLKEFLDEEMDHLVDARVKSTLLRYLKHLNGTGGTRTSTTTRSVVTEGNPLPDTANQNDFTTPIEEPRKSSHVIHPSKSKVHVIPSARGSTSRQGDANSQHSENEEENVERWREATSMELTNPDIEPEEVDNVPTKHPPSKLSLPPVPAPKKPSSGSHSLDTAHVPTLLVNHADDANSAPTSPREQVTPRTRKQNASAISVKDIEAFLTAKKPKIPTLTSNTSELFTEIDTMIEKLSDTRDRQGLEVKVDELSPIEKGKENPFDEDEEQPGEREESPTIERDEATRDGRIWNPLTSESTTTTTTELNVHSVEQEPKQQSHIPPVPQLDSTLTRKNVTFAYDDNIPPMEDEDADFSADKVRRIDRSTLRLDDDEPLQEGEDLSARLGPLDEADVSPKHFEHVSLTKDDLNSSNPPPPKLVIERSPPKPQQISDESSTSPEDNPQIRLRKTSPTSRRQQDKPSLPQQEEPINIDDRIQQLINETGSTLSRKDLMALARVRVPTLARYYEDIARGLSKRDAFEEMRMRALTDMLEQRRTPWPKNQAPDEQREELTSFCEEQQPKLDQDKRHLAELQQKYELNTSSGEELLTRALTEKAEYCQSLIASEQRNLNEAESLLDALEEERDSPQPVDKDKIHDTLVRWAELDTRRRDGMSKLALEDLEYEELLEEARQDAATQTPLSDQTPTKLLPNKMDAITADSLKLPLSSMKSLLSTPNQLGSARSKGSKSARSARSRSARSARGTPRRGGLEDDMHGVFEPVDESDPLFLSLEQNMNALSKSKLMQSALSSAKKEARENDQEESVEETVVAADTGVVKDFSDWKKLASLIKEHQSQLREKAKQAKETSDSLLHSFSFRSRSHLTDDSDLFRVGFGDESR
uniref:Uncharacterized protein n=1 Tax=Percolomonas cosmopolitus TaxID=63605 RepID=A0A7S1PH03_9EUKA